jgi:hypothetical protein
METKTKRKATRVLKDLDFSKEGCAVALVGPSVGGAANTYTTLIAKSLNFSEDFIKKMQAVQVTLELPDFLERFFGLYGSDAEVLARLMGYVEDEKDDVEEENYWENYIQERLSAFKVLETLNESESVQKSLADLTEEEYLSVLNDQKYLEGIIEKAKIQKDATGVSGATKSPKGRVSKKKEIPMTQEVEMVEKSQLAAVEKALAEQQTLLQKALETVAKFEAEKKEAITKARFDSVKQAVASEEIATILFKAVGLVEDEAVFVEVVKALGDMKALVEKSAMFQEVGASAEESAPAIEESGVTKLLKAQFGVK